MEVNSLFLIALLQEAAAPTPTPISSSNSGLIGFLIFMTVIGGLVMLGIWFSTKLRARFRVKSSPPEEHGLQKTPVSKPPKPESQEASSHAPLIFVSYRRHDSSDVTGRIYDRLIQHFGKDTVFKDVDSIPLGVDFRKHLGDSVGQCNVLLAIIGRQWLTGKAGGRAPDDPRDYVRVELEAALQRGIPVIPVLVQGATLPEENDLATSLQTLAYRNGISVRPDPDFHQDVDRLIKGIEAHLKRTNRH